MKDKGSMSRNKKQGTFQKNTDNKKRKLVMILILSVAVLVGLTALGLIALTRHEANDQYCESLDPTSCGVDVQIYNDTNSTYVVKQCSGQFQTPACKAYADTATLRPGQSTKAFGTTQNDPPQPWMIFDENGKSAGCIDLHYTKYVQQPVVAPLSKLISCKNFL